MKIIYCFASPTGDVPVDDETLKRPFIAEPLQYHPFMTLGDFFDAARDFILSKEGKPLTDLLSRAWSRQVTINDIDTIVIRYEKYGTLYQITSVDIISGNINVKFAVSAALTPFARENIEREYNLISELNMNTGLSYLPRVFFKDTQRIEKDGRIETMALSFAEWFEGYHEWHYYRDMEGRDRIAVWDMGGGNRFVSWQEAHEIISEASKILTLYYDIDRCKRIFPWHNGAGDFAVRIDSGKVHVRLVTVRGYKPYSLSDAHEAVDPQKGLLLFLLEVATKMRMDKREGVGYTTWADSAFAKAAAEGFLQAMKIRGSRGETGSVVIDDFFRLVQSLTQDEMLNLLQTQLGEYKESDTSDHEVLTVHLEEHARDLVNIFQNLSP